MTLPTLCLRPLALAFFLAGLTFGAANGVHAAGADAPPLSLMALNEAESLEIGDDEDIVADADAGDEATVPQARTGRTPDVTVANAPEGIPSLRQEASPPVQQIAQTPVEVISTAAPPKPVEVAAPKSVKKMAKAISEKPIEIIAENKAQAAAELPPVEARTEILDVISMSEIPAPAEKTVTISESNLKLREIPWGRNEAADAQKAASREEAKEAEAQEQAQKQPEPEMAKTAESKDDARDEEPVRKEGQTDVIVDNGQRGETVRVALTSWKDLPFKTVKHQAYDFSCGSAAVATLMTYAYATPTTEAAVFKEMFDMGNKEKIRREGFSMLDMSNYLNRHGLEARGYHIKQKAIDDYRLPFIALVNNNGYNHFVVVKASGPGRVLVGDPNTGNKEFKSEDFGKMWNGLALVVVNKARKGHEAFENPDEWHYARARAPVREGNVLGTEAAELAPTDWQIAPIMPSMLPAAMIGATTTLGGGS